MKTSIFYFGGCLFERIICILQDAEDINQLKQMDVIGMVGVNIPIPVPMAFHSFGGWKRSYMSGK